MVTVPLASEVVVRIGEPFEKPVGRIEPDGGAAMTFAAIVADLVHRNLAQPRSKQAFALCAKSRDFADDNDENLLGQVG
jgi:hypothetical protein